MRRADRLAAGFLFFALPLLSGCASLGPKTIMRDRPEYDDQIAESWKKQMLLNIVKLRYADVPTFLDVSSVINQYGLEQQISGGASVGWPKEPGSNTVEVGGSTTYHDNPTITYTPLSGQKFTKSLLTPIPMSGLLSMIQSGWPVDLIFSLCVNSINGIENYSPKSNSNNYEPFMRLVSLWRELQDAGLIDLRVEKVSENEQNVFFVMNEPLTEEIKARIEEIRGILHAKTGAFKARIVSGVLPANDQEIAVMTRSVLNIMIEMSYLVQVPEEHVRKEFVIGWHAADLGKAALMRIRSGLNKPQDAYAAVRYRGYWFWIDQGDFSSKRNFTLLLIILSLTETDQKSGAGPLLTI